jgi:hypothetical protein
MIKGESTLDKGIDFIRNSQFTFVPTGSRYFGNSKDGSDYDFMIELPNNTGKKSLDEALRKAGFIARPGYENHDESIMECYHYGSQEVKIDVQIVKDIKYRMLLDESLKKSGLYSFFRSNFPEDKLAIIPVYKFANMLFKNGW